MISALRLKELAALVAAGREAAFYSWPEWLALREDVLKLAGILLTDLEQAAAGAV